MATENTLKFGRVLEEGHRADRKVWLYVIPALLVVIGLLVFSFVSISKASGLSMQLRQAQAKAEQATKALEERDKLLGTSRQEEGILKSAGQGTTVLAPATPNATASGVAMLHPEYHALTVYLYGVPPPPNGQEYRVTVKDASGKDQTLGAIEPDQTGNAYYLSKQVPEGAKSVAVVLAPKGDQKGVPAAGPILAGNLPGAGEAGVVAAAAPKSAHARAPGGSAGGRARRTARPRSSGSPPPAPVPSDLGGGLSVPQ